MVCQKVLFFLVSCVTNLLYQDCNVVYGDIFIIPSHVLSIHDIDFYESQKLKNFNMHRDLYYLKVWACSPTGQEQSDNWFAHGHKILKNNFPRYLPLNLFVNNNATLKKDGDQASFLYGTKTIILTLNQKHYRYGYLGSFDEALKKSKGYTSLIVPYLAKVKNSTDC